MSLSCRYRRCALRGTRASGHQDALVGEGKRSAVRPNNKILTPTPNFMARRRRRNYKIVNAFTKNMGSGGGQVKLGYMDKVDAQGITAWANNFVVSCMVNNYDGGNPAPGVMVYATTGDSYSDDSIITARAFYSGGTVSLALKRGIVKDSTAEAANDGRIFLWAELTDITVSDDVEARFVVESWGNFIEFTEA